MKESTKKILAFSLVLVVLGGVLGTIGFALGGIDHSVWTDSKGFHRVKKDERVPETTKTFSDAVKEINLSATRGDVEIVQGGTKTKVVLRNLETTACTLENGVLTVTSKHTSREGFSIGFNHIDESYSAYTTKNKVTVYLPANTDLSGVTLENAIGNIRLTGLRAGQLDLSASFGDINISNSTVRGRTKIDSSRGNVSVNGTFEGEVGVNNDWGDVRFESVNGVSAHNYKLETSVGTIHFPEKSNGSDAADSLNVDYGAKSNVTVSTSLGDITIR
ncbi:MAG: DUF4097 family beta strand repeat protein [Coriobacteriia bacterium]|nr:DUF4097 family beta strand repeat protein [Coriobacteriia bacterium]